MTEILMEQNKPAASSEQRLVEVEAMLATMLASHDRLAQENQFLRQRVSKLTLAKATLLDKNRQAAQSVKRIISQLREEIT